MATRTRSGPRLRAVLAATAVAVLGTVASVFAAVPVVVLVGPSAVVDPTVGPFAALFVASYVGYAFAGVAYLHWTGRGLAYLDVRIPTRRDLLYVGGGTVGIFTVVATLGTLVSLFDVPSTPHNLFEGGLDPNVVLVLIPLVLFVNAPVEELLFRNVVQKRLAEDFSDTTAVVLGAVVFAVVHVPAYYNPALAAMAVSLALVFVASLVFGYLYVRTDNVVVPSAVHGIYNAVQIALFYVVLTSEETTLGLLLG